MKVRHGQSGLTLIEMLVVIAIVALLVSLGLPAVRAFFNSFQSQDSAKSMISAALASARAIAAREQRYAGIRFQKAYQPEGVLKAPQYMIFVVQDPDIMAYGFRAVEGLKPIKLPDTVSVMDLTIVTDRNTSNPTNSIQVRLDSPLLTAEEKDNWLNSISALTDVSAFSVIFSPNGKLVIHGIQIRNKDGERDTNANIDNTSEDIVFNKKDKVKEDIDDTQRAMFCQDDYYGKLDNPYPDLGLGPEPSRASFVIYGTEDFERAYKGGRAWSDYLVKLASDVIYINPYAGTITSSY